MSAFQIQDVKAHGCPSRQRLDKNDVFYLQYIEIIDATKTNKVTIFNRWGDVVFDVENYDNANRVFRGLSNDGKELPSGIYFYKVVFGGGAKGMDGFISLRR